MLRSVNHELKNRTTVGLQEHVLKMKALLDGYSRIVPCDAAGVKTEQEMKIITFMGKKIHVAVLPSTLEKLTRETFNRGLQY